MKLVFEVAHGPEAPYDRFRTDFFNVIHEQSIKAVHDDLDVILYGSSYQIFPFLNREEGLLLNIDRYCHNNRVEEFETSC
ncbi:MAG: hypothetical protein A4E65_03202 [Syntrophorhabdus sp. PtaU1.Bin153]|nr:MAG: hypothetical protein A4E65_03202 [Syntrophorhabdus sp. PtaU1.Bin153]